MRKRRVLALLLALSLVVSGNGMTVLAAEQGPDMPVLASQEDTQENDDKSGENGDTSGNTEDASKDGDTSGEDKQPSTEETPAEGTENPENPDESDPSEPKEDDAEQGGDQSGDQTGSEDDGQSGDQTDTEGEDGTQDEPSAETQEPTVSENDVKETAFALGKEQFVEYQHTFGFGLKTNIDLAGEARTASMVYNKSNIGMTDLATNSFGQSFNATMIQMITGFCSLINGGNYYAPHLASRIMTADGATIENVEPRLLKQTISRSTSDTILEYCNTVVTGEFGTGKTARPAGYMIGGKTGTAETLPRGNNEYVVSFMGYAPADDPQIAIYVVVDRPNVAIQDNARHATGIVKKVLTEVLPYLNIFMTEELSDAEREELEQLEIQIRTLQGTEEDPAPPEDGNPIDSETAESGESGEEPQEGEEGGQPEEQPQPDQSWKNFPLDPETGYLVDPETGAYVDPELGTVVGRSLLGETSEPGTPGEPPSQDEPEGTE